MQATPTQVGYRITGRAPFFSNCYDANWIATSAVIGGDHTRPEGQGGTELVMVYLPQESCEIIDTCTSWGCAVPGVTTLRSLTCSYRRSAHFQLCRSLLLDLIIGARFIGFP